MKKSMLVLILISLSVMLIGFVNAEVRINEVMPHTNNSLGNEWVEFYNNASSDLFLANWTIWDSLSSPSSTNFSINIPAGGYGLLVDDSINCSSLTLQNTVCMNISWLGAKLNDGADSVSLYNNSLLLSNFTWTSSLTSTGKSWSYNGSGWQNCIPTPGAANNCSQQQAQANSTNSTCTPYYGNCGDWGTCSGTSQTRTCINRTIACINNSVTETQSCSVTPVLYVDLNWTEEPVNGQDFDILVNAYNLGSYDYDIRIWLQPVSNDTVISERYDGQNDEWKSGVYYINKIFSGAGNRSNNIKLRINGDYPNFFGGANIYAKIRKNGDDTVLDDYQHSIEILEKASTDNSTSSTSNLDLSESAIDSSSNTSNSVSEGVIILGKQKNTSTSSSNQNVNSIIYKSKNEYIKEYAPYAFSLLCISLIIVLLVELNRINKGKLKDE